MSTLILTDLHYTEKPPAMLGHQVRSVCKIINEVRPTSIIFMGDLIMHRKPSPTVLLALKRTLRAASLHTEDITILRGNHDSETKADDGVTALSLFDSYANIITLFKIDHATKRIYIPHYENESKILEYLGKAAEYPEYTVFGHFGYRGCMNSVGDLDFSLKLSTFKNKTWLGHIHTSVKEGLVTILGTPYTTNFGECDKESYYGLIDDDGSETLQVVGHGPRHLRYNIDELDDDLISYINDTNYNTYLRLFVDRLTNESLEAITGGIVKKLEVESVDIKYKPVSLDDDQSNYRPERGLFSINDVILEDYIDNSNTTLSREDLIEGLKLLKDEN